MTKNLFIAENATLVLPLHKELDEIREDSKRYRQDRHHKKRNRTSL